MIIIIQKNVKTSFKTRYANHKKLFNLINYKNDTTLFIEYCTLKENQQTSKLTWEMKGLHDTSNSTWKTFNFFLN